MAIIWPIHICYIWGMFKGIFWQGTCDDDAALVIDDSRVRLPHGDSCTIECAAGYIGRPRDLVQVGPSF